jgi:hypothetical protein
MMRYQVITVQTPQEILEQAIRHFGPQGAGLHMTSQNLLGVVFQGGGGYVVVTLQPSAEETVVELETREWDFPVQQFMARIHRRRRWWQRWRWGSRRPSGEAPRASSPFRILDNDR